MGKGNGENEKKKRIMGWEKGVGKAKEKEN